MSAKASQEWSAKALAVEVDHLRNKASHVANQLRSIADRIDAIAIESRPDQIASAVTHEIVWGIANTGMDRLGDLAANVARAEKELTGD